MSLKQTLKNSLSASIFHLMRDVPWIVRDWTTKPPTGHGPIPPLRHMFDGPRGYEIFLQMGQETLGFYKNVVEMKPSDAVLDIGCGIGRKTLPLLGYLNDEALYVGMDIDRRGIDWLLRNVTSQSQRFVFFQLDIYSKFYNPKGALIPGRLVLPFPDNSFDVVALWSVFTHMYPDDIAHYLSEIARVLKPSGNQEIIGRMQRSETKVNFAHELPNLRTTNPNIPEDAIAVNDQWLLDVLAHVGLKAQDVLYGSWSGHAIDPNLALTNYQDIILAQKT